MKVSVVVKVQPPGGVLVLEILHVQPIDELFGEADQIASAIVPRGSTGPIRSEERRRTLESWPLVASSRACGPGHDSFASLHGVQPPGVSAMRSCSRLGCSPLSTPLSSRWSRCWSRGRSSRRWVASWMRAGARRFCQPARCTTA